MVRYADDFVITGVSKEFLENEVKPVVEAFLAERGLTLSQEKTRISHIEEGFDFLGQNVRKYGGNPFDPSWDQYFVKRKRDAMIRRLEGRKFLLKLWMQQDGVCPGCGQLIEAEDRWNVHHKVQRAHGGDSKPGNLELRHPNCHRQVHHPR